MEYRQLGRSGLQVSPLCLGTMMFGGATDEPHQPRRIVGRAARGRASTSSTPPTSTTAGARRRWSAAPSRADRDCWVLATKLGNPTGPRPERPRPVAALDAMLAAEASLRRLGTDFIDIYYLHKEDHDDAAGRDGARAGRPDPRRQDPPLRRLQLPRLARSPRSAACATSSASTGRWSASPTTTRSTACRRSSSCRPAPTTASASCPTARSRAACSPASTGPARRRPTDTRAGARRQAHDGDRMARRRSSRIAQEHRGARRGARHHRRRSSRSPGC